jgi:hypothetical protein
MIAITTSSSTSVKPARFIEVTVMDNFLLLGNRDSTAEDEHQPPERNARLRCDCERTMSLP